MELNNKTKKGHYFKMGNIFIDEYAKHIGPIATAIYTCLKRHANIETRIAFPSYKLISEELGINPRTVLRHIPILVKKGFITIEKRKYKGRWRNNTYFLTQSRDWLKKPYDFKSPNPYDKKGKNHVNESHINNTHIKNNSP